MSPSGHDPTGSPAISAKILAYVRTLIESEDKDGVEVLTDGAEAILVQEVPRLTYRLVFVIHEQCLINFQSSDKTENNVFDWSIGRYINAAADKV